MINWSEISFLRVRVEPLPEHPQFWDVGLVVLTLFVRTPDMVLASQWLDTVLRVYCLSHPEMVATGKMDRAPAYLGFEELQRLESGLAEQGIGQWSILIPTGGEISNFELTSDGLH